MPQHAIVGHLVVIVAPLVGVLALVYAAAPRTRRALRWPLVAGAAATLGLALWAGTAGGDLLTQLEASAGGDLPPQVERHGKGSDALGVALGALTAVAAVVAWRPLRPGRAPGTRKPAVLLAAAGVLVLVTTGTVLAQAMEAMWATHSSWTP